MKNNKSENTNNENNKNQNLNKNIAYPKQIYPYYPPMVPYYPRPLPYMPNVPNKDINKTQPINNPNINKNQIENTQHTSGQAIKQELPKVQPMKNISNSKKTKQMINPETQQLYIEPKLKEYNNEITAMEDSKKFSIISLILGIISVSLIFLDLPCGVIGLFFALRARHIEKNIFSTIGMITSIIGIAKSIILIVLFNLFVKVFAGIFLFMV